jgi:hypothetical protein
VGVCRLSQTNRIAFPFASVAGRGLLNNRDIKASISPSRLARKV